MGNNLKYTVTNFIVSCLLFFHLLVLSIYASESITEGEIIGENQTLISENQYFELGFFRPSNSSFRYLAIWYYKIQEKSVIWVANREKPLVSVGAGGLRIGNDGNLELFDGDNITLWSSDISIPQSDSTKATLTNEGDFILRSLNDGKILWRMFENYRTDTFLPGMRILVSQKIKENRLFSSWKSENDPSVGNFSMGVDSRGSPQIIIWEGTKRRWRSGHWDSQRFTGLPNMSASLLYGFTLSSIDDEGNRFFTYTPLKKSDKLRFRIRWDGKEESLRWEESKNHWDVIQSQPANKCDEYNKCGNFGFCSEFESPKCKCIDGFEPRNADQWNRGNYSGGCIRRTELLCERKRNGGTEAEDEKDGFLDLRCAKLPDFMDLTGSSNMENCKEECLGNCSCTAYAYVSGIGCMIWSGELIDVQEFDKGGKIMKIRLAHADLVHNKGLSTGLIVASALGGAFFFILFVWLVWRFKTALKVLPTSSSLPFLKSSEIPMFDTTKSTEVSKDFFGSSDLGIEKNQGDGPELPLFNFNCVASATGNFSQEHKLGQGGFGPVFKGKLPGGEEIAVKRLSVRSGQGLEEFKNEITLIAKLQHRNLVRLLGYCINGEDKMLLYEYMPNKSLDCFIFAAEPARKAILDWRRRFAIIEGIARGLLYLHQDSRLTIIHRDLKASNILLDENMNPKISDFGMARIFGGNQNEANTNRVVGTYGYMAPEYAMEGLFSMKSDVYSFGVLLLEIVCGRRNTSFRLLEESSLIEYAWRLWKEGKAMDIVDSMIRDTCCQDEVLRCIHIGMLCVQDSPDFRPAMRSVVLMLESESIALPTPRQPTFASVRSALIQTDSIIEVPHLPLSSNDMTFTTEVGR